MASLAESIAANLKQVRLRISRAAERARRDSAEITLVAVCKTHPPEAIRAAYESGLRDFGENRVQEREAKSELVADLPIQWHLIGHLQSNKTARAVKLFSSFDSVDSLALAQKLDRAAASTERLPVLLEIRTDDSPAKTGVRAVDVAGVASAIFALPHLELRGLMSVPPYFDDPTQSRPYFRQLRELLDELATRLGKPLPTLSMGMSHDFEIAIEEGATQIRVGTALFGPRPPK
jgi:PLP dependent protein